MAKGEVNILQLGLQVKWGDGHRSVKYGNNVLFAPTGEIIETLKYSSYNLFCDILYNSSGWTNILKHYIYQPLKFAATLLQYFNSSQVFLCPFSK